MGNRVLTGVNMKGSMAVDSLVLGNHRLLNLVNMKGSMAIDGLVRGTEYLPCEHEGQHGYRWAGMGNKQITYLVSMKGSIAYWLWMGWYGELTDYLTL